MEIKDCMKRNVFSIRSSATIGEAARMLADHHIGTLPVVDSQGVLVGVLGLRDLLNLALPSFTGLIDDLDFVHDFGAVESSRPDAVQLAKTVTTLMRPVTAVPDNCGLLRSYALMLQHRLHDIPVVDSQGYLVGIASRVDIGTTLLAGWESAP